MGILDIFKNREQGTPLRVLSTFDGIACGRVALERAGIPVESYTAYEIDEDAIKVATTNYPDIIEMGDVFKAQYKKGQYDLLIGGSPCTHWSIAKAGNGREVTASGIGWELFKQYVRALREAKPKYFLYENNYSMATEIRDSITEALGVEPIHIDSADFSAQHRHRYYWTNIPVKEITEKSPVLFRDIVDTESEYKYRDFSAYADTLRFYNNGLTVYWDTSGKGHYSQTSRAANINQKWTTVTTSGCNNVWVGDCLARNVTPLELERLQTLPDNYTQVLGSDRKRLKGIANGWTVDVIVHLLQGLKEV